MNRYARNRQQLLQRNLQTYLDGTSGIEYDDLVEFADPLFSLFDVDLRSAHADATDRSLDELSSLLAVLDTARLFWTYCSLSPADQPAARLEFCTLFESGDGDLDEPALDDLIDLMCSRFRRLTIHSSRKPGSYLLPDFHSLIADFQRFHHETQRTSAPATEEERHPEALAAFARPLFDHVDLSNVGSVEDALARAQAYRDLARLEGGEFEAELERIGRRFRTENRSENVVKDEARTMVRRYRELFR